MSITRKVRSFKFRYRSYQYDQETGLYFLRSRYYNPNIGRFLNADAFGGNVGGIFSHNVFAYCSNNPIMTVDADGELSFWIYKIQIPYPGLFHAEVQLRIKMLNPWLHIESGKAARVGSYRVDVYNPRTDEIWEIKPDTEKGREAAEAQLDRYISSNGRLERGISLSLPVSFKSLTMTGVTIYLTQSSPGVILYRVERDGSEQPEYVTKPSEAYNTQTNNVPIIVMDPVFESSAVPTLGYLFKSISEKFIKAVSILVRGIGGGGGGGMMDRDMQLQY